MARKKSSKIKTITLEELGRLAELNSPRPPRAVVVRRLRRMEWTGIGWLDCGDPRGDEVIVKD